MHNNMAIYDVRTNLFRFEGRRGPQARDIECRRRLCWTVSIGAQ